MAGSRQLKNDTNVNRRAAMVGIGALVSSAALAVPAAAAPKARRKRAGRDPNSPANLSFVRAGNFWAVESTGDYLADCDLGHRLGEEYIAHVGQNPTNGSAALLGWIVTSMAEQAAETGANYGRGLRLGFMKVVNTHAIAVAALLAQSGI